MTHLCKSLISLVLSVSLVFSSLAPAWAGAATPEELGNMRAAVSTVISLLSDDDVVVGNETPENPRCTDLWNNNSSKLLKEFGEDVSEEEEEGMFSAFCAAWIDQIANAYCAADSTKDECQYSLKDEVIIRHYKNNRVENQSFIREAYATQQNAASTLVKFLGKAETATCDEIKKQCKGTACEGKSVYSEILGGFVAKGAVDQEGKETFLKLLRDNISSGNKTCFAKTDEQEQQAERLGYVALLGMIGGSDDDANAIGSYLRSQAKKEGGPTFDDIFVSSAALMSMDRYDRLGAVLAPMFSKPRSCPSSYGIGFTDMARGLLYLGQPSNSQFDCGWENSWILPSNGHGNYESAWAQLGQIIGYRAAQGDERAAKLLKGLSGLSSKSNKMFTMGVIVSGQHPIYNKNNPSETAKFVEKQATNLMLNLDPPTRAYVRDGLYTIYTEIAGKSAEQAAEVPLLDWGNIGKSAYAFFLPVSNGQLGSAAVIYSANPGLYPAGSDESSFLLLLEYERNLSGYMAIAAGFIADVYLGIKAIWSVAKCIGNFFKTYYAAYKMFRTVEESAQGAKAAYSIIKSARLAIQFAAGVQWIKGAVTVKAVAYRLSSLFYRSRKLETSLLRSEINLATLLNKLDLVKKGKQAKGVLEAAAMGKGRLTIDSSIQDLLNVAKQLRGAGDVEGAREVAALAKELGREVSSLGLGRAQREKYSFEQLFNAIKEGKLDDLRGLKYPQGVASGSSVASNATKVAKQPHSGDVPDVLGGGASGMTDGLGGGKGTGGFNEGAVKARVNAASGRTVDERVNGILSEISGYKKDVPGILRGNEAILTTLENVERGAKQSIITFLNRADANAVGKLESFLKVRSRFSLDVDAATLQFLTKDSNGAKLLEMLKGNKWLTAEEVNSIKAMDTSEFIGVELSQTLRGQEALKKVQSFLAREGNGKYVKQFLDSEPGKVFFLGTQDGKTVAAIVSDMKGRIPSAQQAQNVFRDQIKRVTNKEPWHAAKSTDTPGFPRNHIVDSGNGFAKVVSEREYISKLASMKIKAENVDDLEVMIWEEAFSADSGRAKDIAQVLKKLGIKPSEVKDIHLRVGFHEVNGSHVHTVVELEGNRIFTHTQDISFSNKISGATNVIKEDMVLKGNVYARPGKRLPAEGKREFMNMLKSAM